MLLLACAAAPAASAPTARSATAAAPSPTSAPPSRRQGPPAAGTTAPADGEVDAHVAVGHRLSRIGRYEDAMEEFRRAVRAPGRATLPLRDRGDLSTAAAPPIRRAFTTSATSRARPRLSRAPSASPTGTRSRRSSPRSSAPPRRRGAPTPDPRSDARRSRHRHHHALPGSGGAGGSGQRSAPTSAPGATAIALSRRSEPRSPDRARRPKVLPMRKTRRSLSASRRCSWRPWGRSDANAARTRRCWCWW